MMEKFILNHDIQLICVQAVSFPNGVEAAYANLLKTEASFANRTLYGISRGSDGGILYWAAVEEKSAGEGSRLGLEQYTIKKGLYAFKILNLIKGKEYKIGEAFSELLKHPNLDETGECVEWYKSADEVQCMVRILE